MVLVVLVMAAGTEGDLNCEKVLSMKSPIINEKTCVEKCKVTSLWDRDTSLVDQTHAAGSSELRP